MSIFKNLRLEHNSVSQEPEEAISSNTITFLFIKCAQQQSAHTQTKTAALRSRFSGSSTQCSNSKVLKSKIF